MATTYEHLDDLYVNRTVIDFADERWTIADLRECPHGEPECADCVGIVSLANVAEPGRKLWELHVAASDTITTVEG